MILWNTFRRQNDPVLSEQSLFQLTLRFVEENANSIVLEEFQGHLIELWKSGQLFRDEILVCIDKLAALTEAKPASSPMEEEL